MAMLVTEIQVRLQDLLLDFCLVLLAVGPFSFFLDALGHCQPRCRPGGSVQLQQPRSSASVQISETGFGVWHCVDEPDSTDSEKGCSARCMLVGAPV